MDELDYLMNSNTYYDTWDRHNSIAISATKGLRNAPGENNCFVNSAVQVFWHLDVFRRSYRRLNGHTCMGDSCIFCALKIIFTQFQYSDQKSLHPDALRKALAETFANQQRFQLGHMDDAAECFENILRRIHFHIAGSCEEDTCNAPHCLPHQKFAMQVVDQVVCPCGASSNPLKFHEMVHYISSSALVSQARSMQETGDVLHPDRFGLLLRNASTLGDIRDCPGSCGKKVPIRRTLVNCPDVVSIGLVWECDHPTVEMTTEVARNIGTTILLQDVFHSVMQDVKTLPKLHLVGVVCYYGKHYSTFLFHSKQKVWIYFDDATVREIGPRWENVVEKCGKGRYQPLLLLYANPNAVPVPVDTAPRKKVMAPGYSGGPMVDDSDSGHDRTHDSIASMNPSPRRSRTPNPDTGLPSDRRSRTPGPEYRPDPNNAPKRTDSDHKRQPSFLIAMSGKERPRVPLRPGGSAAYVDKENIADHGGYNHQPMNKQSYDPRDRDLNNQSRHVDDYTLSTRDQYRRPSLNGFDSQTNSNQINQQIPRPTESQRKETFKKGNNKFRADVIRYVGGPNTQNDFSGQPGFNAPQMGYNGQNLGGPPSSDGPPPYQQSRPPQKQNLDDSISVHSDIVNPNKHKVIKPSSSSLNYENINNSASHNPVEAGIATLPRNKKHQNIPEQGSMTRQASMGNLSVQGTHSRPTSSHNVVDGPSTNKSEVLKPKQIRKTPAQVKRASDKKKPPPPQRSNSLPRGLDQHPEEFVDDKVVYIDRRMVANVLDYQRQSSAYSTTSQNSGTSNESDSLMNKLLASKGLHKDHGLSVEIPYDNVSLGSHKDSGYGSSDRNSSSSTGSTTMDPYNQFFLTRGMIVPTPTPMTNTPYNQEEVTHPKIMPVPNSTNSVKPDPSSRLYDYGGKSDLPPPVPIKNYNVERECTGMGLDLNKDGIPGIGKEAMKNEQYMSLIRFSEDLMDQCILAETNKDYPSAIHYCDSAIGYLKNAIGLKNITHQMLVCTQSKRDACMLKSRSLHVRLSSRSDSKLSIVNDLTGSTDNRSSINSSDSDLSRASQDRTRRINSSTETLDSQDKGYSQPIKMSPSGGNINELDRQSLHNKQKLGPETSRSLCRTLSDHSKSAHYSHSDNKSSSRSCAPPGHTSQNSRDSTISGHANQNSRDSTISGHMSQSSRDSTCTITGHVSQSSTLSNNSEMYGSLPRRTTKSQLSKDQQQDVYQSYLNKQKSLHQGVEHSRTSSGSSTSNSQDGSVHSDNSGSDPQLRSHLRSQPRMSKSDIRQILQKNIAMRQSQGQGQVQNAPINRNNTQQGQGHVSSRVPQNSSSHAIPTQSESQYRHQNGQQFEVGKSNHPPTQQTATHVSGSSSGFYRKPPLVSVKPPVPSVNSRLSVKPPAPIKPSIKQKPKMVASSLSKSSNCLSIFGDKPLERSTSQPNCQKLVDSSSSYYNQSDKITKSLLTPSDRGLVRPSSSSQPDLRVLHDERFTNQQPSQYNTDSSEDEKLDVKSLASRFESVTKITPAKRSSDTPVTGHRVRSKSESSSSIKKPKSVLLKNKNKESRPRKSVTFSENLALVAGEDFHDFQTEKNNIPDDHAYFSDDDDRRPHGQNNDEDIDSNNSDESPPIGMGPGFCQLCQKKGIEIDENYCSKCRFYMHRFMPSS